ncbi:MAG: Zn-ribbon domain-containing OB-fold protein [Proteobacteria bacterium]|nr:Zn-ribbon domain-containing OB-fold protein [Pseudomonadota bacterium]
MNAPTYDKPLPDITALTRPFWDGLREHRLVLQACARCHTVRHYPRPVCDRCYSMESVWVTGSGHGTLHSWTVNHHPFHFAFKRESPFITATVDLAEGVRMQAPLRDADAQTLKMGMPVELIFEDMTPELTLPAFRLALTSRRTLARATYAGCRPVSMGLHLQGYHGYAAHR